jgi:hypothetical protein
MSKRLVDTGVLLVAEGMAPDQAGPACVTACDNILREIEREGGLVVDNLRIIVSEYGHKLNTRQRQLKPGARFLLWVLRNLGNPDRVEMSPITRLQGGEPSDFVEFPASPALANFDRSDRVYVATANGHPRKPPILVSVDTDWLNASAALAAAGITVQQLCPADLARLQARKQAHN